MELTQFRYNTKSNAFIDLYGNIMRKCTKCNRLKDIRTKRNAATIDHVIALANGGTHTYSNTRTCCSWCNSNKRDL